MRISPLLVDLYEITMGYSYFRHGKNEPATFELFVRKFPRNRNYLVSAGIDDIVDFLVNFRFTPDEIDYLRSLNMFSEDYLDFLARMRFTGDMYAIPSGEIYFPGEPVVVITAPRIQAQILETALLNQFNFQSMIATKGARVISAARGRACVDFSPRRDHGIDASIKVAKNTYMVGFIGTSNLLAGKIYGIPVFGTMAHSYIMSFESEEEAFKTFATDFPNTTLLIDTYDVLEAAKKVIELVKQGYRIKAVRIDSGDLVELSRKVREMFREAGLDLLIFLSGDLDEYAIDELLRKGAEADAFGVGTRLGTSSDIPYLNGVYKLVEDDKGPRVKLSPGKVTLAGKKMLYRVYENGRMVRDIIALHDEKIDGAEPLLLKYIEGGRPVREDSLDTGRERFRDAFSSLPEHLKSIYEVEEKYPVYLSEGLREVMARFGVKIERIQ